MLRIGKYPKRGNNNHALSGLNSTAFGSHFLEYGVLRIAPVIR